MAWNQPGKGGQDPWRGKNSPNPVDAFFARLREMFGGAGGGAGPIAWLLPLLGLLVVMSSFKLIDEQERGVVLRLGAYSRTMTPGANFKWPWPIETVTVVPTTRIQQVDDQVRVLTQDENIVDIKFTVQYQVANPRDFLYAFRDDLIADGKREQGRETLRNAAESAVREAIGNHTLDTVLLDREKPQTAASEHLQDTLDSYHTGLLVTALNLTDARPPTEVKEAFDEANRAAQDKENTINIAKAYSSKVLPEARGVAARITAEAAGYRSATIAKAEGDAQRFRQLADQYRKAPEVTRKRLFLETMQEVMAKNPKVVAGRGNILYLPLNSGAGAPPPANAAPLTQLPEVRALPEQPRRLNDERPPRESREGGR
ncbi:FtsH protease activity modulator HflK [Arenimonas sp.]|uniref:FtsH protease activity modulator HflK n=1 Tax=Arenimonas sp. TaxID=1872635 RepID=UPI0039E31284